jgi:hypothetical protein
MVPTPCGHSSVGRASASQADSLPSKSGKIAEWFTSRCATKRHNTPQIATSIGDFSGDRFRALSGPVRFCLGRVYLAALALLLLPACADLRAARQGCPIADLVEAGPIAVDLNPVSGTCPYYLRYQTVGAGSLELDGCTHVTPPERFDCGLDFAFVCPGPVLDAIGTQTTIEVIGDVRLESLRAGPVGDALVTVRHPEGWVVCEGVFEVDAWPEEG